MNNFFWSSVSIKVYNMVKAEVWQLGLTQISINITRGITDIPSINLLVIKTDQGTVVGLL